MSHSPVQTARLSTGLRLLTIILAFLALDVPVTELTNGLLLLVFVLAVLLSPGIRKNAGRWMAAICLVTVGLGISAMLPNLAIQERHNLFLPEPHGTVLKNHLPAEIYAGLAEDFYEHYPADAHCAADWPGCWRFFQGPRHPFSRSFDDWTSYPDASRTVSGINISGLQDFRGGFLNDLTYNWYRNRSEVKRPQMPFFAQFIWPENIKGSQLSWIGTIYRETADGQFEKLDRSKMIALELTEEDVGKSLYLTAVEPHFFLKLHPPLTIEMSNWIRTILQWVMLTGLFALLVRFDSRRFILPFCILAVAGVVTAFSAASLFGNYSAFGGGGDGLVHEGNARIIAAALLEGNWSQAAQGGENIFYFMPGLRYVRAVEKLLFGDTHMGYLWILLLYPVLLFFLLKRYLNLKWAVSLIFIFLGATALNDWGFSFRDYVDWVREGYPETAGYAAFLAGFMLLTGQLLDGKDYRWQVFWSGILLALAVAIRPNLAVGVALLLTGTAFHLLRTGRIGDLLSLCFGFSPVLLLPLHNWIFGQQLVLLTASATITANIPTPPSVYMDAFHSLFTGAIDGEAFSRIWGQIAEWSERLNPLSLMALAAVMTAAFSARYAPLPLRLLAWAAIAQHGVLFFYLAHTRYKWLAWLISLLILAYMIRTWIMPWLKYKYPDQLQKISTSLPLQPVSRFYQSAFWSRLS